MKGLSLGPRAQAVVVLALVAALGALLGILGDRYVARQRVQERVEMRPPREGGPARGAYLDRIASRLDLTDEQRAAIDSILAEQQVRVRALTNEFQPQFRAIAAETRQSVEAVLTPGQRELMRTMRRERLRRLGADRPGLREMIRPGPGAGGALPRDSGAP